MYMYSNTHRKIEGGRGGRDGERKGGREEGRGEGGRRRAGKTERKRDILTSMAEVLTSYFLKMAKASSKSSLPMQMVARSGAS